MKLAVKDENGSAWKELSGTELAGMNVVDYDLSADPKLADAAEKAAREKALAKEKTKDEDKEKGKGGPVDEEIDEEGGESGEKPEEKADAAPPKVLDPELYEKLTDPLRAKRQRYLPPGKYTIEIVQGITVEKTTLVVKPERDAGFFGGDEAAPDRE